MWPMRHTVVVIILKEKQRHGNRKIYVLVKTGQLFVTYVRKRGKLTQSEGKIQKPLATTVAVSPLWKSSRVQFAAILYKKWFRPHLWLPCWLRKTVNWQIMCFIFSETVQKIFCFNISSSMLYSRRLMITGRCFIIQGAAGKSVTFVPKLKSL